MIALMFAVWLLFVWIGRKIQLEVEKTRFGAWIIKWLPAWTIGTMLMTAGALWWASTWNWS